MNRLSFIRRYTALSSAHYKPALTSTHYKEITFAAVPEKGPSLAVLLKSNLVTTRDFVSSWLQSENHESGVRPGSAGSLTTSPLSSPSNSCDVLPQCTNLIQDHQPFGVAQMSRAIISQNGLNLTNKQGSLPFGSLGSFLTGLPTSEQVASALASVPDSQQNPGPTPTFFVSFKTKKPKSALTETSGCSTVSPLEGRRPSTSADSVVGDILPVLGLKQASRCVSAGFPIEEAAKPMEAPKLLSDILREAYNLKPTADVDVDVTENAKPAVVAAPVAPVKVQSPVDVESKTPLSLDPHRWQKVLPGMGCKSPSSAKLLSGHCIPRALLEMNEASKCSNKKVSPSFAVHVQKGYKPFNCYDFLEIVEDLPEFSPFVLEVKPAVVCKDADCVDVSDPVAACPLPEFNNYKRYNMFEVLNDVVEEDESIIEQKVAVPENITVAERTQEIVASPVSKPVVVVADVTDLKTTELDSASTKTTSKKSEKVAFETQVDEVEEIPVHEYNNYKRYNPFTVLAVDDDASEIQFVSESGEIFYEIPLTPEAPEVEDSVSSNDVSASDDNVTSPVVIECEAIEPVAKLAIENAVAETNSAQPQIEVESTVAEPEALDVDVAVSFVEPSDTLVDEADPEELSEIEEVVPQAVPSKKQKKLAAKLAVAAAAAEEIPVPEFNNYKAYNSFAVLELEEDESQSDSVLYCEEESPNTDVVAVANDQTLKAGTELPQSEPECDLASEQELPEPVPTKKQKKRSNTLAAPQDTELSVHEFNNHKRYNAFDILAMEDDALDDIDLGETQDVPEAEASVINVPPILEQEAEISEDLVDQNVSVEAVPIEASSVVEEDIQPKVKIFEEGTTHQLPKVPIPEFNNYKRFNPFDVLEDDVSDVESDFEGILDVPEIDATSSLVNEPSNLNLEVAEATDFDDFDIPAEVDITELNPADLDEIKEAEPTKPNTSEQNVASHLPKVPIPEFNNYKRYNPFDVLAMEEDVSDLETNCDAPVEIAQDDVVDATPIPRDDITKNDELGLVEAAATESNYKNEDHVQEAVPANSQTSEQRTNHLPNVPVPEFNNYKRFNQFDILALEEEASDIEPDTEVASAIPETIALLATTNEPPLLKSEVPVAEIPDESIVPVDAPIDFCLEFEKEIQPSVAKGASEQNVTSQLPKVPVPEFNNYKRFNQFDVLALEEEASDFGQDVEVSMEIPEPVALPASIMEPSSQTLDVPVAETSEESELLAADPIESCSELKEEEIQPAKKSAEQNTTVQLPKAPVPEFHNYKRFNPFDVLEDDVFDAEPDNESALEDNVPKPLEPITNPSESNADIIAKPDNLEVPVEADPADPKLEEELQEVSKKAPESSFPSQLPQVPVPDFNNYKRYNPFDILALEEDVEDESEPAPQALHEESKKPLWDASNEAKHNSVEESPSQPPADEELTTQKSKKAKKSATPEVDEVPVHEPNNYKRYNLFEFLDTDHHVAEDFSFSSPNEQTIESAPVAESEAGSSQSDLVLDPNPNDSCTNLKLKNEYSDEDAVSDLKEDTPETDFDSDAPRVPCSPLKLKEDAAILNITESEISSANSFALEKANLDLATPSKVEEIITQEPAVVVAILPNTEDKLEAAVSKAAKPFAKTEPSKKAKGSSKKAPITAKKQKRQKHALAHKKDIADDVHNLESQILAPKGSLTIAHFTKKSRKHHIKKQPPSTVFFVHEVRNYKRFNPFEVLALENEVPDTPPSPTQGSSKASTRTLCASEPCSPSLVREPELREFNCKPPRRGFKLPIKFDITYG